MSFGTVTFWLLQLLGIPVALVYSSAMEWGLHRYLLHGLGKNKASFFSFHWHDHHREARKGDMFDPQYVRPLFTWTPQGKEALSVAGIALAHAPLLPFFPIFTLAVFACALRYYFVHRRAHLDGEWARKNVPVHYDHHMGIDQNANWCVTNPLFDHLMGTRKVYAYDETGRAISPVSQQSA